MSENTPKQPNPAVDDVTGYRRLNEDEITWLNAGKSLANRVGDFVESLNDDPTVDKRWLAIARTDLQKGFMSLIRSIAKPTSF